MQYQDFVVLLMLAALADASWSNTVAIHKIVFFRDGTQ